MTTLGIIGSGNIGGTVARLAVDAGHSVLVSNSRGPDTLKDLVVELGPDARAVTREEAALEGELVLVSLPVKAYPLVSGLSLSGKTVMDSGNYFPPRDGTVPELDDKTLTDSEYLARHLPGAHIVKVFNNIFFKHLLHLARPAGAGDRSFLPIAGDAGKPEVVAFLDSIGYGAVDGGGLAEGWRLQPGMPLCDKAYGPFEDEDGTPAGADAIRSGLAAAKR